MQNQLIRQNRDAAALAVELMRMLTISKSLSAGQARTYHSGEFTSEEQATSRGAVTSGRIASGRAGSRREWGLHGEVGSRAWLARLMKASNPENAVQLVKHQPARTYENEYGKEITSVEHRAGWDATFSAPKSVSLTALVGGDDRVREAHRESVRVALGELEPIAAQARIGNVHAPETTGKFIAATFEHDTARPVDGYALRRNLYTHAVIFNVTERENGQDTRARRSAACSSPSSMQPACTAPNSPVRLYGLGYEIERGKHGQPEIKGYTQEYLLRHRVPRREQIKEHLQEIGRVGAGAAQVAAHRTRDTKELAFAGRSVTAASRTSRAVRPSGGSCRRARQREQAHHHAQQPEKTVQQSHDLLAQPRLSSIRNSAG